MMNRVFTGLPVWTLLCVGLAWSAHSGGSPPHIVFVIGDDVGWSNTALHDTGSDVRTPTLQRLAADGVHLLYGTKPGQKTRSCLLTQLTLTQTPLYVQVLLADTLLTVHRSISRACQ